ncbi:MAG TPA: ABC transporter permease [Candidatus Obscuribacterales bacterium]
MLGKPWWLHVVAAMTYIFMYLPIFILILFSFEQSRLSVHLTGFTLDWYAILFQDEAIALALSNSLIVAAFAVLASAVMGTMAAVGLTRLHFRGKEIYRGLILLPIIIPEIAMAVSALILFIAIGLPLGLATVIVSHIVFCVAYVTLTVMGRLEGLDPRLEEAAQDLGASPLMAFFRVTLPLLMPGIVAGSLLAFVLSLDDFVITQFTAGVGSTTLPLRIYSMVKFGVSPEINALSTLMIIVTFGLTIAAEVVRGQKVNAAR